MGRYFNLCDAYILIWCLYNLQGVLFTEETSLGKVLVAIICFAAIVCFYLVNKGKIPKYIKCLNVLFVTFLVYGLFAYISGASISINGATHVKYLFLKNVILSLSPIYVFYYFTKSNKLDITRIKIWTGIFLLVTITSFYQYRTEILLVSTGYRGGDDITNNVAYSFVALLIPITLFREKPIVEYLGLAVCFFFTMIGVKRGAAIIGLLAILLIILDSLKAMKRGKIRVWLYIVIIAFVILCISWVENFLENEYFLRRIEETLEGSGSGREHIWHSLWQSFTNDDSIIHLLFGRGADSTIGIAGNFAHNDWLEILINQGLLGIVIYFIYWRLLFITYKSSRNKTYRVIIGLFFFIYFCRTFMSMSYSALEIYATCAFSYALCKDYEEINNTSYLQE